MPCSVCLRPNGEHAATCPNNDDFYGEEIMKTCPICGNEYPEDEMDYAACDECIMKHTKFDTAIAFGNDARDEVSINGLFARVLTQDQIDEALKAVVMEFAQYFASVAVNDAREFIGDNEDDFADWLVEQEKH